MIFITGHHNTGKSTIAKWLISIGFSHVETGDIVRKNHKETAPEEDFYLWIERMHQENPNYSDNLISTEISKIFKQNASTKLVVTGNRQIKGINHLKQGVGKLSKFKHLIIFLHAPEEELYRRQTERKDRIIPGLTFDIFKNKYLAYDETMGIKEIKEKANHIIENLGNSEKTKNCIIKILKDNFYLE